MPYVNAFSLADDAALDLAPDLDDVLTAVVGFVEEILVAHDEEFAGRVATYFDDAVTGARPRADSLRIMGDPARYAEVVWAGLAGTWEGRDLHRFNCFLFYGQGAATREAHAAAFRALAYSQDVAPADEGAPGLLFALRRATLDADAGGVPVELHLGPPESVAAEFVKADPRNGDWRWELSFSITAG